MAVVGRYSKVSSTGANVPEVSMENLLTPLPIEYAETKWCCKQIVQNAHTFFQYTIKALIVRINQLWESLATGVLTVKRANRRVGRGISGRSSGAESLEVK